MLQSRLSFSQIGVFSMAAYPYSMKLLWSPIVDSCYSPRMGRRKSWIVPAQVQRALWRGVVAQPRHGDAGTARLQAPASLAACTCCCAARLRCQVVCAECVPRDASRRPAGTRLQLVLLPVQGTPQECSVCVLAGWTSRTGACHPMPVTVPKIPELHAHS